MPEPGSSPIPVPIEQATLARGRRVVATSLALACAGYLLYAVSAGVSETAEQLARFEWWLLLPVVALTLVNYGLRFLKWVLLLRALGIDMPLRANAWAYIAGLGMVVSPGKAGELIKPWAVLEVTATPMARTVPALVAERLTDLVAVVLLAALGVLTYVPENTALLVSTLVGIAAVVAMMSSATVASFTVAILAQLPWLDRLAPLVDEALAAMRTCLAPGPMLATLALSLVAWWAECVGYWLVLAGLDVPTSLGVSTFLYAFATVFGAPSPGGLGMADVALVEASMQLVPELARADAIAGALIIRVATLWLGVGMGVVALLGLDRVLRQAKAPAAPKS